MLEFVLELAPCFLVDLIVTLPLEQSVSNLCLMDIFEILGEGLKTLVDKPAPAADVLCTIIVVE